ncbi:hypothetical protein QAD02_011512, partial [Eretmocerus hayati]
QAEVRAIFIPGIHPNDFSRKRVCPKIPGEDMNSMEFIKYMGYPVEEHFVTSEDGYILRLHRIPATQDSPAVLLHHGLLESSFSWLVNGRNKSLAFILASEGYDVWLGNARGNTYSRNHTTLSTSDSAFWDFSWHEMGIYDLPAEIQYISNLKDDKLFYIGHSMGTTIFLVMAAERPDIAFQIKAMIGLAPAAYLNHMDGLFRTVAPLLHSIQVDHGVKGASEFFGHNALYRIIVNFSCDKPALKQLMVDFVFSIVGFSPEQLNTTVLPLVFTHSPAGTSLKTAFHYIQNFWKKNFRFYDYGQAENLRIYNNKEPPEYNISKISVPIAIYWAENDFLSRPADVVRLYEKLEKKIGLFKIEDPKFNHEDFIWGIGAPELVYKRLLEVMEEYR